MKHTGWDPCADFECDGRTASEILSQLRDKDVALQFDLPRATVTVTGEHDRDQLIEMFETESGKTVNPLTLTKWIEQYDFECKPE